MLTIVIFQNAKSIIIVSQTDHSSYHVRDSESQSPLFDSWQYT